MQTELYFLPLPHDLGPLTLAESFDHLGTR